MVVYHPDRLTAAGLVARGDMISHERAITDDGYGVRGRVSPAADATLGRALRLASAAGEPAAVRAFDVLEVAYVDNLTWLDPDPRDDWTVQPLSGRLLGAVLVATLLLLVMMLAVVAVWS